MPSPKIIPSCANIVQRNLLPNIPSKWRHQFKFGVQALTLKPFSSLASNARQTVRNPHTASTKIDRLIGNLGLAEALSAAAVNLGFIHPTSIVACDHSDFNGLSAFVGAVQTRRGRAVPCLIEAAYSLRLPAHNQTTKRKQAMRQARHELGENLYEQAATSLEQFAARLGFWPRLVFDRGFGGMPFVKRLLQHQAIFYIRLKAGRYVEVVGQPVPVRALVGADSIINLNGIQLRVIRSEEPKQGEPWFILTSDFASSRDQIIQIYYHRFEIEETFKDLKHVLELHQARLFKPLSLKVLLWFAALSVILSFLTTKWQEKNRHRHPKKTLSHYKMFFEAGQRAAYRPLADLITGGL